ncbi:uncharacterized protein LOC131856232 [Cryptomeria japonica]|uniref:uncharacterized protein LOC131856232 n=1 Tax=Cryptomeria japonica TaxID=3369 RepID=UPI0027D9F832|nr:uncharacterized protein LOC131856232 [Cryptomeria japonica]
MSASLRVFAVGSEIAMSGQCGKQFNELRFLQACTVSNLAIDILKLRNLRFMDYYLKKNEIWSLPGNFSGLQVLKLKSWGPVGRIIHLDVDFGLLTKLKHLELEGFHITEVSSFVKVYSLQKLKLFRIQGLKELPGSIGKLRALRKLYLVKCYDLTRLAEGFGQLCSLTELDLQFCQSLQELSCDFQRLLSIKSLNLIHCSSLLRLPEGIESLSSLQLIDVSGCSKLTNLQHRVCQMSFRKGGISFSGCSSLKELPEEICKFTMLTSLSLSGCESLKVLPIGFGQLGCLKELGLEKCEGLQELCEDFHCLGGLRRLKMSGCKSLSRLPQDFGKLSSLERLVLSECDKLEELCSDIWCLGALKFLELSRCKSLSKLPDCFGQLGCLKMLDLSMCFKLEELSSDFHCLTSLTNLDLSKCQSLAGKWIDVVGSIQSLWRLNILGCEEMNGRWKEMKKEEENWHFVVLTDSSSQETGQGQNAILLKGTLAKIFEEEGLLVDINGHPFYSSTLPPGSALIFIIHGYSPKDDKLLEKSMKQLELNTIGCSIIYAGGYFNALAPELKERILAYTASSSKTYSFFDKLYATFPEIYRSSISVFRSRDSLEVKGIKCPSAWEDVSYILNEHATLLRAPRESNVEILRAILQTDFLFKKSQQVKLIDLQGKVILVLDTSPSMHEIPTYSAFNEIYMKMQDSHQDLVEVVWVGLCQNKFETAVADAPWPVVPVPWLLQNWKSFHNFFSSIGIKYKYALPPTWSSPEEVEINENGRITWWWSPPRAVVVDGLGRISNKNAWEMIERWGVEAFPFSVDREEELRKSEWEKMFNYNQFVFQNMSYTQTKVKHGPPYGELMLLFVGEEDKMLKFTADLAYALTKLKSLFSLCYIRHKRSFFKDDYELQIEKMNSIPSISLSEAYRFWERMEYLYSDLTRMGSDDKIVQVRRMVCGIISAESRSFLEGNIRVIVVDEKGEVVSGSAKEVVKTLLH